MFSHMRDEEHKMIDKYAQMRDIKKGEILYLQGSSDKNIYILKKGTVKITKLTPQGKEIIIDIFKGGSIFGEMTVIESHERDESAEVIEDGLICTMSKDNFNRLLQMVPGLSVKITKMITMKNPMIIRTVASSTIATKPVGSSQRNGLPSVNSYRLVP